MLARAAGLEAVCFTEHDRLWPDADLRVLSERHGIPVFGGAEVTTELGHILVYGVDALPPGAFLAATLLRAVRAAGGLAVLAHPARAGQPQVARARLAALFDSVEVLNGSDGPAQNRAAAALAAGLALPGIAGSDCHQPAEVGRAATVLPARATTMFELIAVLRLGRHTVESG